MPSSAGQPAFDDKLGIWALALTLGAPVVHILLRATPLGTNFLYVMIGMPVLLACWICSAVLASALAVYALTKRMWYEAIACTLVPVIVWFGVINLDLVRSNCNYVGDILHFRMMRNYYLLVLETMPRAREPKLVVFNWGGMIWASAGVVYDESDEVVLPSEQQSAGWKRRADNTELGCGKYYINPMGGHFYLAEFPC